MKKQLTEQQFESLFRLLSIGKKQLSKINKFLKKEDKTVRNAKALYFAINGIYQPWMTVICNAPDTGTEEVNVVDESESS